MEDDEEDRLAQHGLVLLPLEPLLAGEDVDLTSASHLTLPLGPLVDEDDDRLA